MRTHPARIFPVFLLALTLLFSGCGNANTEKSLEQFLDTMLTAPAPTVAAAMETVTSDEDLAAFSDAVLALLGDDVADEAKDSFVANRINPLQSVLLTSAQDCSTVPTSITLSEPTVSNAQERCYPYTAQLAVTTPDSVYENCTVSGQLRVDQAGKVLSITMDFSDALCDALGVDALIGR
jgi:hypothetical protein